MQCQEGSLGSLSSLLNNYGLPFRDSINKFSFFSLEAFLRTQEINRPIFLWAVDKIKANIRHIFYGCCIWEEKWSRHTQAHTHTNHDQVFIQEWNVSLNYSDAICNYFPLNSQSNAQLCSTLNCAAPIIVDEYFKSDLNRCTPYRPNELISCSCVDY